jgi:hypothetical protein
MEMELQRGGNRRGIEPCSREVDDIQHGGCHDACMGKEEDQHGGLASGYGIQHIKSHFLLAIPCKEKITNVDEGRESLMQHN